MKTNSSTTCDTPNAFVAQHQADVLGELRRLPQALGGRQLHQDVRQRERAAGEGDHQSAKAFRVLRPPTGPPEAPEKWRQLRRSTAGLYRRAQVSHRLRRGTQRYRALNPFGGADAELLQIVNDAKWTTAGFTNADLRAALHGPLRNAALEKKRAGQTTRQLRLLRAQGLIRKVRNTHRYHVTSRGRRIITALLTARRADTEQLTKSGGLIIVLLLALVIDSRSPFAD